VPRTIPTLLMFALFAGGAAAGADDAPAVVARPGYKIVMVHSGARTIPVQVKDTSDPFRNVKSSATTPGKYDPSRVFSATSSMADKSFNMSSNAFANRTFDTSQENHFVAKSYDDTAAWTQPTTATSYRSAFFTRPAADTDRTFAATRAEPVNRAVLADAADTSADRARQAALGGPAVPESYPQDTRFAKQYLGPAAQHVPPGVEIKENVALNGVGQIPNRPLSVDEVRDLINHGTKPNFDQPPPEASKPLNDPNHVPEPLRDDPNPSAGNHADEDKDDAVPSPGTMAGPEVSEPLPQK
jgi:hypothetical protein